MSESGEFCSGSDSRPESDLIHVTQPVFVVLILIEVITQEDVSVRVVLARAGHPCFVELVAIKVDLSESGNCLAGRVADSEGNVSPTSLDQVSSGNENSVHFGTSVTHEKVQGSRGLDLEIPIGPTIVGISASSDIPSRRDSLVVAICWRIGQHNPSFKRKTKREVLGEGGSALIGCQFNTTISREKE